MASNLTTKNNDENNRWLRKDKGKLLGTSCALFFGSYERMMVVYYKSQLTLTEADKERSEIEIAQHRRATLHKYL